jgi:hypothetical protein
MTVTDTDGVGDVAALPLRRPVCRRRSHLTMTVHPDTLVRMDQLKNTYLLPVGQIVDKLVLALQRCFDSEGKLVGLTCINGEVCRFGRKDGPVVL